MEQALGLHEEAQARYPQAFSSVYCFSFWAFTRLFAGRFGSGRV
jgi:hypothetical protein